MSYDEKCTMLAKLLTKITQMDIIRVNKKQAHIENENNYIFALSKSDKEVW